MPLSELVITAESDNPAMILEVNPFGLDFDKVVLGQSQTGKFEIKNIDSTAVELTIVSPPSDSYVKSFTVKPLKLKPGQVIPVELILRDDIPPGPFSTSLTLDVKGKIGSRVTIPITGEVVEKL